MHVTLHRGSEQISKVMMTAECDFVHPLVQAVRWGSARAYKFSIDIVNLISTETERLAGKGPLAVSYLNEIDHTFSDSRQLFVGIPHTKLFTKDVLKQKSIMSFLEIPGELQALGLVFFAFDETLIVWSDGRWKIQASELACAKGSDIIHYASLVPPNYEPHKDDHDHVTMYGALALIAKMAGICIPKDGITPDEAIDIILPAAEALHPKCRSVFRAYCLRWKESWRREKPLDMRLLGPIAPKLEVWIPLHDSSWDLDLE